MKKRIFSYLVFLFLSGILNMQLTLWQSKIFGLIFFVVAFSILGKMWKSVYARALPKAEELVHKMLGYFTAPILVGFIVGIFLAWYHVTPLILSFSFFVTGILSLEFFFTAKDENLQDILDVRNIEFGLAEPPGLLPGAYIFLWALTLIGLFSPATQILQSPWQHLPLFFLILFFLLTFLLFYLVLSSQKTSLLLLLLVLHSIVLHSYLPLSHVNPWGGDVWRMIAVEEKFLDQKPLLPVLFGEGVKWRSVQGVSVPEALVIPNKYVYSHLWGETVFVASVLRVDLVTLNRFLVPVMWSLLFPLLCFGLGKRLFDSEKKALLFTFFTFLPFPLQALGGLTLAVSLGTVVFLLELFLWFEYLESKNKTILTLTLLLGIFSLFGYTLYFLLFWCVVGISWLLQKTNTDKKKDQILSRTVWMLASVAGVFFFPVIELLSKTSVLPTQFLGLSNIKQFVGQWSGWFYATLIRPHDILSGNVIFNHTPVSAFVSNIFTVFRWPLVLLMGAIAFFTLVGVASLFAEKKLQSKVIVTLFCILFGGYVIGWYVLQGERSFTRRLDPMLALTLVFMCCSGIFALLQKYKTPLREKGIKKFGLGAFLVVLFVSWTTTTIFASGPDMRVVSQSEYDMAAFIGQEYRNKPSAHACVLADTWLLLALEGVSKGNIVGGGFAMDSNFGQKEREQLYADLLQNTPTDLKPALLSATGADACFVVVPKKQKNLTQIREKFGNPTYHNETLMMWKVGLKS